jgi:hypothetical protein
MGFSTSNWYCYINNLCHIDNDYYLDIFLFPGCFRFKKKSMPVASETEQELEDFLFVDELKSFDRVGKELEQNEDFFFDNGQEQVVAPLQPAWIDESSAVINIQVNKRLRKLKQDFEEHEIEGAEYEKRLRMQFEKLNPTPKWAKLTENHTVISNDILTSSAALLKATPLLNPDRLDVCRVSDANQAEYSQVTILFILGNYSIFIISPNSTSSSYRWFRQESQTLPH